MRRRGRIWTGPVFTAIVLAAALVLTVACDFDGDDETVSEDDSGDDDDTQPPGTGYRLDFQFEYRDEGTLIFWEGEDGALAGTIGVAEGNELLPGGNPLNGRGRFVDFPESGYRMLTMTFQGPPTFGPCADLPVTHVLALTFRPPNGFLYGGLSAFCGEGSTFGRPVRLMRLSGLLERDGVPHHAE